MIQAVVIGAALSSVLSFPCIGLLRVWWPVPLNELELGVITHVRRVVAGLPVYAAPSVDFVPLAYPPFFYYVAASLWRLIGAGFVPVRLVSFAASTGSIALVALIVRRETQSWRMALVAGGLQAAVVSQLGGLALARVDALLLFLILAGLYQVRGARSPIAVMCAGILFGLASLTKQSAVLLWVSLSVWMIATDRRRAVAFTCGFLAAVGIIGGLWQRQTDAWFAYYTLRIAANQRAGGVFWAVESAQALLRLLPFAAVAASLMLVKSAREQLSIDGETTGFWSSATIGALLGGVGSQVVHGSLDYALLPVCTCLIIQFAICVDRLRRLSHQRSDLTFELLASTVCVAQFAGLAYAPSRLLPGPAALGRNGQWVLTVSRGPERSPIAQRWLYWSVADVSRHANREAVIDLIAGGTPTVIRTFREAVRQAYCFPTDNRSLDIDADLLRPEIGIFPADQAPCAVIKDP